MRKVDLRPKRCEKKYREMAKREKKYIYICIKKKKIDSGTIMERNHQKNIGREKAIYMKIETPNECQL